MDSERDLLLQWEFYRTGSTIALTFRSFDSNRLLDLFVPLIDRKSQ